MMGVNTHSLGTAPVRQLARQFLLHLGSAITPLQPRTLGRSGKTRPDTHFDETQRSGAQRSAAERSEAQRSAAERSAAQRSAATTDDRSGSLKAAIHADLALLSDACRLQTL